MALFLEKLERSPRSVKPRKSGITVVIDSIGMNAHSPMLEVVEPYLDRIKLTHQVMWTKKEVVEKNIKLYQQRGIEVSFGGVPYEIATLQGQEEQYLEAVKAAGVSVVEVEGHAGAFSIEDLKTDVRRYKGMGFKVVGEVGHKWVSADDTRPSRDRVFVDKTIRGMTELLEAGVEQVYWEGMVVRALVGSQLENKDGQRQLLEVAKAVGPEHIVFEVWDARGGGNHPIMAWMVYEFGPEVNFGNIGFQELTTVEAIRHGTFYEMDHPYMRWLKDGKPTKDWWRIEPPDYDIDMQKGAVLKPTTAW